MRPILIILTAALGFATAARGAHTEAKLVLATETAVAGKTVLAGVHLRMEPQWHTYWKNAGASGIATTVTWTLPAGIHAGGIEWPVPEKMPPLDLVTYVYEQEVVLIVPLTLDSNLPPGSYPLKAKVAWLECKESCIPGSTEISATLNVGPEVKPSAEAGLIEAWQKKLPQAGDKLAPRAWWESATKDDLRPLVLQWNEMPPAGESDFYPAASDAFELQGETERLPSEAGKVRVRKLVKKFQGDWPKEISGVMVQGSGPGKTGYEVTVVPAAKAPSAVSSLARPDQPLWQMLLFAFIGGLILNVMPCVLPVIALKIVGFVSESQSNAAHVRKLGLIYAAGVLASFLALGGIIVGLKAAGHQAGWGIQFSSPYFLLVMTALVTLIALNLFGVFEVSLGGRTMGAAARLSSRRGPAGAFFNGLLATLLATSCTAPFLGTAVGFAFAQPAPIILLILLTVGAGLSAPYVVLSWQPAWMRFLPKPGRWMERFKVAMGFPMLAAAIWLCSLLSTFYGERTWAFAIFLVFLGVSAWIYGEFVQRSASRRGLAAGAAIALLFAGYVYALENELRWRQPLGETGAAEHSDLSPDGLDWQPWSAEKVAAARKANRPVLVDFTARWCLTCQKNVKPVLAGRSVQKRLKELNAVTLIGDYTRFPKDITDELNRFGRAGVPLVLVYPEDPDLPPVVLPEALTSGIVLGALDRISK